MIINKLPCKNLDSVTLFFAINGALWRYIYLQRCFPVFVWIFFFIPPALCKAHTKKAAALEQRQTEIERKAQTTDSVDRGAERERERERERETETETETERQRETETETERDRETETERDRETQRETERER